jgi:hypothetical protein
LVMPLMLGRDEGWPTWAWVALLASIPALALFIAVERRVADRGGHPVLQLRLFRSAAVSWGLVAQAAATVTYASLLFVLAIYLQHGLGKSPLYSGLVLIPWVIGFGVSGPLTTYVPERFSARIAPAGFALLGSAFLGIALEALADAPQGPALAPLLGLGGLGMGAGFSSLIAQLTAAVKAELASDLSGIVSTNSEVAAALGVAIFGTLYLALAHTGDAVHALTWAAASLGASALLAAAAAHRATARRH